MQKIAFYINMFLDGGIETSLIEYLANLDINTYDITLLIGIKMDDFEIYLNRIPNNIEVKYIFKDNIFTKISYLRRLKKLSFTYKIIDFIFKPYKEYYFKKKFFKIIKSYNLIVDYAFSIPYLVNKIFIKKIAFFHFNLNDYYVHNKRRFNVIKENIVFYDRVIVLNSQMLELAQKLFSNYYRKFILMYNQFNFENIINLANNFDEEITNYNNYIISVGRLEESFKDFTNLINAYKIVKDRYRLSEKLLIIGSGIDKIKLQKLITKLDLTKEIIMLGHKTNPLPWIKKSKAFIFSSKSEAMGMVLVEAMILNVPIVATDCPDGPREILLEGKCGLLVPIGNPNEMAKAIYKLLTEEKLRLELTFKARASLSRFNIKENKQLLDKIFKFQLNKVTQVCR